jgi:hypothetical protein
MPLQSKGHGMTSEKKVQSNRKNAARSSGARTAAGKSRSSRNARKHGLAVPIAIDQMWSARIDTLARHIVGDRRDDWHSRELAEVHVAIYRARVARTGLFEVPIVANLCADRRANYQDQCQDLLLGDNDNLAILQLLEQMMLLDRYERRALSRRNHFLRRMILRQTG